MTIQPIGSASVALYITPADLKEHGLTPAGLTLERALAITQTAFHEAGITLEGSIEIEAYPDACGVLVFAHVRAPERAWFSFDELEPVVAAARDLAGCGAALVGGPLVALAGSGGGAGHCAAVGVRPL